GVQAGHTAWGGIRGAVNLILGKPVPRGAEIPIVARMLKRRGLAPTDENALDIIRELFYAHEVAGHDIGRAAQIGAGKESLTKGIENLLEQQVGVRPFSMKGVKAASALPGKNPREWKPVAASTVASEAVETMNRATPFLNLLRKGVDPGEAARMVRDTQLDYS